MDADACIAALDANAVAIAALARAMPADAVRVRPTPMDWSALDVLNHLGDEEREDFRTRLDAALRESPTMVPPIDPAGWVEARAYATRDYEESLARFLVERQQSLRWLRGLVAPDWSHTCLLPSGQHIRAGDLLAAWVAHDLLHLRQLVAVQYHAHAHAVAPYHVAYAGDW